MKRRQRWYVLIVAFILSALLIYGMYMLQQNYIRAEQTVPVYVASKWLQAGHILSEQDVTQIWYPEAYVTSDMALQLEQLLNKELVIPIGQDEPILLWKLNSFHLLPRQDEATFQIPAFYIKSAANDLRAGDYVYVYISEASGSSKKLFEQPIKVAAVKTSTNAEVESVMGSELEAMLQSDEQALYQHRRRASGVIEYINLNLTEEQWLKVDEHCKALHAQLILAYTPYYIEMSD